MPLPDKVQTNLTLHREVLSWLIDYDYDGVDYDFLYTYTPDKLQDNLDRWVEDNATDGYDWDIFALIATKGIRAKLDMEFLCDRMNEVAWFAWTDSLFGDEEGDSQAYSDELDRFKQV